MENRAIKVEKIFGGICIGFLFIIMLSIVIRFLSRQILIDKLHMDNAITRIIWLDNDDVRRQASEEKTTNTITKIDWEILYPFDEVDELINEEEIKTIEESKPSPLCFERPKTIIKVEQVKEKVGHYAEDLLIGYNYAVGLAKKYDTYIGFDGVTKMSGDSEIIYLNNGYLTYVEPLVEYNEIIRIADSVADFSEYLSERNIDFVYINSGSKVCPYDKQLSYVGFEYSNENGDALMNALAERGVVSLDMREEMIKSGLDWYDSYYITDHHWKTETGLWASQKLAMYFNSKFGYNFDIEKFNIDNYDIEKTEKFWLGGQGRKAMLSKKYYESYAKIIPKYDTDLSIEIPSKNICKSGDYEDTLFDKDTYEAIFDYSENDHLNKSSAYYSVAWRNDPLGIIRNNGDNSNKGKKILFLQDSFCWYSTTFLACDIEAIDIIHPEVFTGSIRRYVDETKPDMVVMMFCEKAINPIDSDNHKEIYELK